MKDEQLKIFFDGASSGNPGPAGIGIVIRAADGIPLLTLGRFIGQATNNSAEYQALIAALEHARSLGARRICVMGDSQLVVRQMRGEYRVRHSDLLPLFQRAQRLLAEFEQAEIRHIPRQENPMADRLAELAIRRRGEVTDVDQPPPPAVAQRRQLCPKCGAVIEIRRPPPGERERPFICACGTAMKPPEPGQS